jgi:hypothetical protein
MRPDQMDDWRATHEPPLSTLDKALIGVGWGSVAVVAAAATALLLMAQPAEPALAKATDREPARTWRVEAPQVPVVAAALPALPRSPHYWTMDESGAAAP